MWKILYSLNVLTDLEQMEKIIPIGKEIHMHFNTPQNGAYMDFPFKKLFKLSWVKLSFYLGFSVTLYM